MVLTEQDIIGQLALTRQAAAQIAMADSEKKNQILFSLSTLLRDHVQLILDENAKDLALIDDENPMRDRLLLTESRILDLAKSVLDVATLADPSGQLIFEKTLSNGLILKKMSVPMGVVGVIYESRPNVTIDVAALCIRSGNAVVLRGGSDAWHTNSLLVYLVHQALISARFNTDLVRLLPPDRAFVSTLLQAVSYVDVIIPRGSNELIQRVRRESLVPTIETGAGVCHTYVAESADIPMAVSIVVNAKVSRPSVCNSLDTIIVHRQIAESFLSAVFKSLADYKVSIFADETSYSVLLSKNYPYLNKASQADFGKEFLDYACSVKVVSDFPEALKHINDYSSKHSEAIVTSNEQEAQFFLKAVDAAAVYWNASTRFTDGGIFELGAEIGISTQKLHARGPFALEKLVTEKWVTIGTGQIR